MRTNGNPTLQQCFDAMIKNTPVLLSGLRKNGTFCDTQTIESIDYSGNLAIFDKNAGIVFNVEVREILIILEL